MPYPFKLEEEAAAYTSQIDMVSAQCRLDPEEEAFVLQRALRAGPSRGTTPSLILNMTNRERLLRSAFRLSFDSAAGNDQPPPFSFSPMYPRVPEPPVNLPVDIESFDTNQSVFKAFLSRFTLVKYSRPEPTSGVAALDLLNKLLDGGRSPGFFYLYDLLTNAAAVHILPEEKSFGLGAVLLRFLPEDQLAGVQASILRVMEAHPHLAEKM
jgi:hypothetical protein